jgi:hypothetical protein
MGKFWYRHYPSNRVKSKIEKDFAEKGLDAI